MYNKPIPIRYCSNEEYTILSDLSCIFTELNIQRSTLMNDDDYLTLLNSIVNDKSVFDGIQSPNSPNSESLPASIQSMDKNQQCEYRINKSTGDSNEKTESTVHKPMASISERLNEVKRIDPIKYDVKVFTHDLKSLIASYTKFDVNYKIELLKSICKCLFHYFLTKSRLHPPSEKCSYELLFYLIEQLGIVDFAFCLDVISDLNLYDDLFDNLFELNSSRINSIIDVYFELLDQRSTTNLQIEDQPSSQLNCGGEQRFQLNATFAISLMKMIFLNKNHSELVKKYTRLLAKLTKSIEFCDDVPAKHVAYELLRMYGFLIEQFLNESIGCASRSVGLQSKFKPGQKLCSPCTQLAKLDDKDLLNAFTICYKSITSLFESKNFHGELLDDLPRSVYERIFLQQVYNGEMIKVWQCIKKFLNECDINLISYEFLTDAKSVDANGQDFLFDYLDKQKNGYLFLAYCFIKSQDIKIVKDVIGCLDAKIFTHPKICFLLAERAFVEMNKGVFFADLLKTLVINLNDQSAIRAYLDFHFKHFGFNKLAPIDIVKIREVLNKVDTISFKSLKDEIIKMALVDPLQVMFHLLNFSTLNNPALLELVSALLNEEFRSICTFEVYVGGLFINFLTSLISYKIKTFDYGDLEVLSLFMKYVLIQTDSNKTDELIQLDKLMFTLIEDENLEDIDVLKKKTYFLHIIINLFETLKVNLKMIDKQQLPPIIFYLLQITDRFWKDMKFKIYSLDLLYHFKKLIDKFGRKEQDWLRTQLNFDHKTVCFYVSDLFDDQLNELIDYDNLNELLYLRAMDERSDYAYKYLEGKKIDDEISNDTKERIRDFLIENQEALTLNEQLNLFYFLIDYLPALELLIGCINYACRNQIAYPVEVVNMIIKNSLYKKSKLLDLIKQDRKYLNEIEQFYNHLAERRLEICAFYQQAKLNNMIIELKKFVDNNKSSDDLSERPTEMSSTI